MSTTDVEIVESTDDILKRYGLDGAFRHFDSPEEIIEHYGVAGMHWGVRKDEGEYSPGAKYKIKPKTGAHKISSKQRTRYKTPPSKLTNEELISRIKRMESEKRYNDLNSRDIGRGEAISRDILENIGKTAIGVVGTAAAVIGIKTALHAIWGPKLVFKMFPKDKKIW